MEKVQVTVGNGDLVDVSKDIPPRYTLHTLKGLIALAAIL